MFQAAMLYGTSGALIALVLSLFVEAIRRNYRPRAKSLPVRRSHTPFKRPVAPFNLGEPMFERAW